MLAGRHVGRPATSSGGDGRSGGAHDGQLGGRVGADLEVGVVDLGRERGLVAVGRGVIGRNQLGPAIGHAGAQAGRHEVRPLPGTGVQAQVVGAVDAGEMGADEAQAAEAITALVNDKFGEGE